MKAAKSFESLLTAAEERVLTLVSQSMTNREIASALGISPATVKRHLENILCKLGARNRVEAAIYGLTLTVCCASNKSDCPLAA
jgi:DNA-binding NarL/FixJ family response regulator